MATYTLSTDNSEVFGILIEIVELMENGLLGNSGGAIADVLYVWRQQMEDRNIEFTADDDILGKYLLSTCTGVRDYLLSKGLTLKIP